MKISKHYSSYSYNSFSTKLFLNVPCDSPHKSCFQNFFLLKFQFEIFKIKASGLTPWSMANFKTLLLGYDAVPTSREIILEMSIFSQETTLPVSDFSSPFIGPRSHCSKSLATRRFEEIGKHPKSR